MTSAYTSVAYAGVASKNVIHNFGAYPAVQCIDSTGLVFTPTSITHNTLNDFTVVFTGLSTGTIVATLGSPQAQSVVTSAISLNLSNTNRVVEMTTAGTTATLPTAVGRTGREFIIDNASTGNINVASLGGTIEGEVAQVVPPSSALVVYSDGTNWRLW
jgi:hypothetical protein